MSTAREALAEIINDRHQETRPWCDLVARTGWQRTNGDDYAIRTAYAAADAILSAFPGIREVIEGGEWEYSIAYPNETGSLTTDGAEVYDNFNDADDEMARGDYLASDRIVRRRPAGPWEVCDE